MESLDKKKRKFNHALINKSIYQFLIQLISKILLKADNTIKTLNLNEKLKEILDCINNNIIKEEKNKISAEYTTENFNNIFKFIKMQNNKYAIEILENILIIVFSFGFNAKKEQTFSKNLYNNIKKLKDPENKEICKWFIKDKFSFNNNYTLEDLFSNDFKENTKDKSLIQKEPFFDILELITNESTKKLSNYLSKGIYNTQIIRKTNNKIENNDTLENLTLCRSSKISEYLHSYSISKIEKHSKIGLIRSLLIPVYILFIFIIKMKIQH
jgi:DNA-binding XRE family transcriptional regulator